MHGHSRPGLPHRLSCSREQGLADSLCPVAWRAGLAAEWALGGCEGQAAGSLSWPPSYRVHAATHGAAPQSPGSLLPLPGRALPQGPACPRQVLLELSISSYGRGLGQALPSPAPGRRDSLSPGNSPAPLPVSPSPPAHTTLHTPIFSSTLPCSHSLGPPLCMCVRAGALHTHAYAHTHYHVCPFLHTFPHVLLHTPAPHTLTTIKS